MGNMLSDGAAWLAGQLVDSCSTDVVYSRGSLSVTVPATFGSQLLRTTDRQGHTKMERTDRDFVITVALLLAFGTPRLGDTVLMTNADGSLERFEVQGYGNDRESPWRYADPHQMLYRIHTKDRGLVPAPTITGFSPATATAGDSVVITGTGFLGTAVAFGGVAAASFNVDSATQITAVVGAGTSGSVSVTTAGGTATRAGFMFLSSQLLQTYSSPVGNVGAVQTDLYAFTTPANTIALDGDFLRYDAVGSFAAAGRLRGYWAGEILFDTGTVGGAGQAWSVRMDFKFRHPIAAECQVSVVVNAVTVISQRVTVIGSSTNLALDVQQLSLPQVFKVTATATNTNDVIATSGTIRKFALGVAPTLLLSENFTGTPGSTLAGRIPTPFPPAGGDHWHLGTSPVAALYSIRANGTEATVSNNPADNSVAYIDVGQSNYDASLDVGSISDEKVGLTLRVQDDTHYAWGHSAAESNHAVYKENNGGVAGGWFGPPAQQVPTSTQDTTYPPLHNFRAVCYGYDFAFWCDGLRLFLGQDPKGALTVHVAAATKVGLDQYGLENPLVAPDAHFDNLLVYALPTVTPGVAIVIANDPFTDVNSTNLTTHVPDIPSDSQFLGVWTVADLNTGIPTFVINGGKVAFTATTGGGVCIAWLECHYYDVTASVVMNISAASSSRQGLTIRASTVTPWDHWRVVAKTGANLLEIVEVVNNGGTVRASSSLTIPQNTNFTIQAVAKGTTITATVNGGNSCSYGSALTNQLSRYHGLNAGALNECTWDNFQVSNNP